MMSFSQYDPRDVALWTPGSVTVNRPTLGRFGRPSEDALILQALEGRRAARARRPRRFGRLRLITRNA